MSCFSPLYVRYYNGEFAGFGGKLTRTRLNAERMPGEQLVPVPCGKCDGCRLDRSAAWADRMLLEYEKPAGNLPPRTAIFVTMTYDDEHIPVVECTDKQVRGNLDVRDTQLFMKRLRKYLPTPVRYYLCGEYGGTTFRPHYHMILFGIDGFDDAVMYSRGEQHGTINLFSPTLARIWQKGLVVYSNVNYKTFAYVARYVLKKQFGSDGGNSFYRGRKPPFCTMSRRPGLGTTYFDGSDMYMATVFDGEDVKSIARPRCLNDKLKKSDPYAYELLSAEKREVARLRQNAKLAQCDYDFLTKCRIDGEQFSERTKNLKKRGF